MDLAVRIPPDKDVISLLQRTGPLLTTSANLPGEKVAETVTEAMEYFGDQVDFYVDGGDMSGRPPSTVIRIIDDAVDVLREGAVKIDQNGQIKL
jgi:L-threonylcarbamoyladenylate synthase